MSWDHGLSGDPRAVHAPEVLAALRAACTSVRAASDPALLELARLRSADLLGVDVEAGARPWGEPSSAAVVGRAGWPSSASFDERDRSALALSEQFVIDVTGVAGGPLSSAAASLGAGVLPFVQGLYLLDVGMRAEVALGRLFEVPLASTEWAWSTDDGAAVDPMAAIDDMLRATGRLVALDPVLRELVRLRGARHHACRRCQSVRSVAALDAGADEALLGADDPAAIAELSPATRTALALTDALLAGRPSLDDRLVDDVRDLFGPGEAVELVCYLVRNAANKIAVAFGADDPVVDEGFEFQVIDAEGDTLTVEAPARGAADRSGGVGLQRGTG